jgi:putative YhdH/YhfP family quinone oxidoreductase
MTHTGGFSEYARIPAEWIVPLPTGLSLKEAMVVGTAGFTAALSIMTLEKMGMNCQKNPEILVTGASGGVGSIAIQLLAKSGYQHINALARDKDEEAHLKAIGATKVLLAKDIIPEKSRALETQKFHYVLDVVGGEVASALIPQIYYGGSMSMCGNAGGIKLNATVMPFILRGVNILGIDSVNFPIQDRPKIWKRFAEEWHIMEQSLIKEIKLEELSETFEKMKTGSHVGRHILKVE